MKILVTGGAGFIGSMLIPELLKLKHDVRVIDNLMYGPEPLLENFFNNKFDFILGDATNSKDMHKAIENIDMVIHLAAIVGYPACKKFPDLAESVNFKSTELLCNLLNKKTPIIFGSTGSNYGAITNEICTEKTPLNPLSLYGETKTRAEALIHNRGNSVCYRFATAYGVSRRMRLDLLINDFVFQAVKNKNLTIYEKNFKRTFIHVRDIVSSFIFAIDNFEKLKNEIYNVGSDKQNLSKQDIAEILEKKINFYLHYAEIGKDEDQRNYEVSYEKIKSMGFIPQISIDQGIDELIKATNLLNIFNKYSNI